jgi:hypothetical protein
MNGLPSLAQAVQSQGRNNDTQLVHMTPSEVQGLESLAMAYGGSLTTNPRTGLKEAGFLEDILPTIAGVGLSFIPGVGPMMAAGLVGGGTALATGNLEKGLMAGLGAFGGAGLGGALAGTGAATAAGAAGAGTTGATQATANMLGAGAGAGTGAGSQAAMLAAENAALGLPPAESLANIGSSASYAKDAIIPSVSGQTANLAGQGITALGSEAGRSAFMQNIGGGMGLAKYGGAAVAPALLGGDEGGIQPDAGTMRPYTYDAGRQDVQYRTGAPGEATSEQQYFTPTFTPLPTFTPGSGSPAEQEDERRRMGVMALAAGSQGPVRMLRGGGDATSDSMDGVIDGEEPVRLATGEVVIDGRAVSEIGNGDNEAGAKKIEAAIDRIHKIRQKVKRGKPSSADKTFASMIA